MRNIIPKELSTEQNNNKKVSLVDVMNTKSEYHCRHSVNIKDFNEIKKYYAIESRIYNGIWNEDSNKYVKGTLWFTNYMIFDFDYDEDHFPNITDYEKELNTQLAKLQKTRQKYMDMYTDDLISREELNDKIGGMRKEIERLENELKMVSYNLTKGQQLENILNSTFRRIEDITDVREMNNLQLKRIIQKIEVDKDGNVDIYLRLLGDLGLDETVLISNDHTQGCDRTALPNQSIAGI